MNKFKKCLFVFSCLILISSFVFCVYSFNMYINRKGYNSKTLNYYQDKVDICVLALSEYNDRSIYKSEHPDLSRVKDYFPQDLYGYSEVSLTDISILETFVNSSGDSMTIRLLVSGVSDSGSNLLTTWEFLFSDGHLIDFYSVR